MKTKNSNNTAFSHTTNIKEIIRKSQIFAIQFYIELFKKVIALTRRKTKSGARYSEKGDQIRFFFSVQNDCKEFSV